MDAPKPICDVIKSVISIADPDLIYLYNLKTGLSNQTTAFKLCLICNTEDILSIEHQIYMEIDCDIPFDILVYTVSQWNELSNDPYSFAAKIKNTGRLLYEKTPS